MYKVIYLPSALQELDEAAIYIAKGSSSPDPAIAFLDAIDDAVQSLSHMPHRHAIHPTIQTLRHEVRFMPVKNHTIFYVVYEDEMVVEILSILHKRQKMK